MSLSGRNLQRNTRLCESCDARLTYGAPKQSGNWAGALRMTREQHDLLLVAAAEWDEISAEVDEGDAVSFVDWIAVDVLREPHADVSPSKFRKRYETEAERKAARARTRQEYEERRKAARKVARAA